MARKKENPTPRHATAEEQNVMGLRSAVVEQPVTETLENNYMPYAMSVIVSRAIPEIDGFKPSHRKLLYCMYKMGLLTGARTKSANIVGATMHYNPHGDSAIYDTMVRLSKGYGALLTPFVDSKGNFGKVYSRDMAWAASRYTEAKLAPICAELFRDIDKDTVDFVPNYDNSTTEPTLLPTTFPNVLVSANMGIAVGMASNICGFNLGEVCETTIALLRDPEHNILTTLPAPDFPTGGEIVCDPGEMEALYKTGRGGVKVRARWRFDPKERIIEIYEIPYSTTVEAIIDKVAELVKAGKLREISDMRDETDLNGLKLAIDVKRDVEPEKLMQKLFRMTPLQDSFACNFNILLGGTPRVCGVGEILDEWIAWRLECVRRRVYFDVSKKKEKLHLLNGLKKILLDIDRAISIIRSTERESDVVPNLMIGFGIDQVQAEYVAEIKLRNINREYILKRTEEDDVEDYPVNLFLSREGYFKKITPLSLRMWGEQKYKENDGPSQSFETTNRAEMLVFTDKAQVYKCRAADFADTKASQLGVYLPGHLGMDDGENVFSLVLPGDYRGEVLFFFENGKCARVPLESYATKTNRKRLTGAYCDKSPLRALLVLTEEQNVAVFSTEGRALVFNTALLAPKTSRATQGVAVMTLKPKFRLERAAFLADTTIQNLARYRMRSIPAAGALLREEDRGERQMTLLDGAEENTK